MLTDIRPFVAAGPETGILRIIGAGLSVWGQRRALARLDDRALADIGLSRGQAEAEAARPLWDVPREAHR